LNGAEVPAAARANFLSVDVSLCAFARLLYAQSELERATAQGLAVDAGDPATADGRDECEMSKASRAIEVHLPAQP
jgi:hypothetical protein